MSTNKRIRVLLVDDHDMVRKGLGVFLRVKPDLELVGEAADGAEALAQCATLQPDIVLMDLVMPVMDGVDAIRAIRGRLKSIFTLPLVSSGH